MTISRRLAAILTADVAGYSRLMGTDEEELTAVFIGAWVIAISCSDNWIRRYNEAKTAIAQGIELKRDVDSLARWRERFPWGNAQYSALFEKTVAVGLRRAGFPETSAPPSTVSTGPPARDRETRGEGGRLRPVA